MRKPLRLYEFNYAVTNTVFLRLLRFNECFFEMSCEPGRSP